jgi:hypothetical protein
MQPFSDYYLLSQLTALIENLKTNAANTEAYPTRRIINELAAKIHGLLSRELMVTGADKGYYDLLLEK